MVVAQGLADVDLAARRVQANLDRRLTVIIREDYLCIMRPRGDLAEPLEQRARPRAQPARVAPRAPGRPRATASAGRARRRRRGGRGSPSGPGARIRGAPDCRRRARASRMRPPRRSKCPTLPSDLETPPPTRAAA